VFYFLTALITKSDCNDDEVRKGNFTTLGWLQNAGLELGKLGDLDFLGVNLPIFEEFFPLDLKKYLYIFVDPIKPALKSTLDSIKIDNKVVGLDFTRDLKLSDLLDIFNFKFTNEHIFPKLLDAGDIYAFQNAFNFLKPKIYKVDLDAHKDAVYESELADDKNQQNSPKRYLRKTEIGFTTQKKNTLLGGQKKSTTLTLSSGNGKGSNIFRKLTEATNNNLTGSDPLGVSSLISDNPILSDNDINYIDHSGPFDKLKVRLTEAQVKQEDMMKKKEKFDSLKDILEIQNTVNELKKFMHFDSTDINFHGLAYYCSKVSVTFSRMIDEFFRFVAKIKGVQGDVNSSTILKEIFQVANNAKNELRRVRKNILENAGIMIGDISHVLRIFNNDVNNILEDSHKELTKVFTKYNLNDVMAI